MRCLIIHNPASGPRSDEIFDLARALSQAGDEVTMRFIGDGMEPEDAAADVREFDRVVVSGGDGTVSNVLDHIRDSHVPTLVFPSGTANLFFNNIGNAPEPADGFETAGSPASRNKYETLDGRVVACTLQYAIVPSHHRNPRSRKEPSP